MFAKLLSSVLVVVSFAFSPAVSPTAAAAPAPCANISRAACTLKGTYRFTADGANYVLSGNLTVKQARTKLQVAGLLRFTQEGGTAPVAGTTVNLTVAYMTNRIGCLPGEVGVSRALLVAASVPMAIEDTPLDADSLADEYSFKVTPRKSSKTLATIADDLRAAGAKNGEIVLLLDGGRSCAVLATRR